ARRFQLVLELFLQLHVLNEELVEITLDEPARLPGLRVAKSESVWMDFLSHIASSLRSDLLEPFGFGAAANVSVYFLAVFFAAVFFAAAFLAGAFLAATFFAGTAFGSSPLVSAAATADSSATAISMCEIRRW